MKYVSEYAVGEVVAYKDASRPDSTRYAQILEVKFDGKNVYYLMSDLDAYREQGRHMIGNDWVIQKSIVQRYEKAYERAEESK
jgi:3-mercaptopyruvate sulfurtransferase SseA